jgi:molybdopterin-guanine dinucleotide biosynthesis protein B
MKIVAVIGAGRKSGKTTTIEALVKELSARNFEVGTIKQIHEEDFSIDKPYKDTWRHAEAGAKIVVSAAPNEVAAIKRLRDGDRFSEAMGFLEKEDLDFVIIEGNPGVSVDKILAIRDATSAADILMKVKRILFISTLSQNFDSSKFNVPVFNPLKDQIKMIDFFLNSLDK